MRIAFIAAVVACAFVQPAIAAKYVVEVKGAISNISSANRAFEPVARDTTLRAGDAFAIRYVFETGEFDVTNLYDADPSINIYYGQIYELDISIGTFRTNAVVGERNFSSVQLWNDYVGNPSSPLSSPTDLFGQSASRSLSAAAVPVNFGTTGPVTVTFNLSAFDFGGSARRSDLISEITPVSLFNSVSASGGFVDSTFNVTSYSINITSALVVPLSAVPEPTTWAMLLVGFGMIGGALRYRRQTNAVTFSRAGRLG